MLRCLRLRLSSYNVALSRYLFVCIFVCVKAGRREALGMLVNRLIMRREKQTAERKSTHAHSRGLSGTPWCWVNFDMERKTGGSLLSTHTRINTHTHALATSAPSLAHAVASEVALNLGLMVSDRPTGWPVICQPGRTKEPLQRHLCLSCWLLRRHLRILLHGNVFLLATRVIKIHKPQHIITYYNRHIIVSPTRKNTFPPLCPLSQHWVKPHAILTHLLFGPFWSSFFFFFLFFAALTLHPVSFTITEPSLLGYRCCILL